MKFIGGLRRKGINLSRPLAVAELGERDIRFSARLPLLKRMWPEVVVPFSELRLVEMVNGALPLPGNQGVTFLFGDEEGDSLTFWCSGRDQAAIGEEVTKRGIPVREGSRVW